MSRFYFQITIEIHGIQNNNIFDKLDNYIHDHSLRILTMTFTFKIGFNKKIYIIELKRNCL